jgi:hypothetical protein
MNIPAAHHHRNVLFNLLLIVVLMLTNLPLLGAAPFPLVASQKNQIYEHTEMFQNYSSKDSTTHAKWDIHNHSLQLEQKDGGIQNNPSIFSDNQGEFYVAWVDFRQGVFPAVYAQKIDADGNRLWLPVLDRAQVKRLENGKMLIQVRARGAAPIQKVWVLLYPVNNQVVTNKQNGLARLLLTRIDLLSAGNDLYQAVINQVDLDHMVFMASDSSKNISIPLDKTIYQKTFLPLTFRK